MDASRHLATWALGALLHDIGKFRERAGLDKPSAAGKYSHEAHTHAFVMARAALFSNPDSIAGIALAHHEPRTLDQKIVAIADRLASAERAETSGGSGDLPRGRFRRPLLSPLAQVYAHQNPAAWVPLRPLDFTRECIFPRNEEPDEGSYAALWSEFEEEAGRIARVDDIESWLYLLQKYTWCMPASTKAEEIPDVSLFDHSRATAALAVCLGAAYGQDESALDALLQYASRPNAAGADTPVALLLRSDVRGIQSFLYSLRASGAARSLRGRSYYIGLVCEAVVRRLLADLGLPMTQVLYSGGGHAYLLLPPSAEASVRELRAELERAIFALHGGELNVSVGWTTLIAGDLRGRALSQKWDEASRACDEAKARPMAEQTAEWLCENVFAVEEQGGLAGRCAICQAELDGEAKSDDEACPLCESFQELGRALLRHRVLALKSVPPVPGAHRARSWRDALRSLGLEATLDGDSDVIMNLDGTGFLPAAPNPECSYGFRPAARVFPTNPDGTLTEFGELAKRATGVKRLAALRMDVDNMGRLFRKGLAEPTLSRVAALSSALGWFYEGYLNEICSEWPDKVYGLYSGGDDLFFVGSWDVMPRLAQKVRDEFAAYCAGNPRLTVSAGISLFPDKYPVYQAARDSDRALAASKAHGGGRKDAMTFLGETVGWNDWPDVEDAHTRLVELISDGGPASILQRLRMLHAMCEADAHQRQPSKRWCWMAAYMLSQMAGQYREKRQAIEHIRDRLTDEAALNRWALAARWVQLERRERAED